MLWQPMDRIVAPLGLYGLSWVKEEGGGGVCSWATRENSERGFLPHFACWWFTCLLPSFPRAFHIYHNPANPSPSQMHITKSEQELKPQTSVIKSWNVFFFVCIGTILPRPCDVMRKNVRESERERKKIGNCFSGVKLCWKSIKKKPLLSARNALIHHLGLSLDVLASLCPKPH